MKFDTNGDFFDTMSDQETVRYLKHDRGRYFYQRRVPKKYQRALGRTFWRKPCGNVDFAKAVQLVVTWAEEHDALIANLASPETLVKETNRATRRIKEQHRKDYADLGLPLFYEMTEQRAGEKRFYPRDSLPRPWQAAAKMMAEADAARAGTPPATPVIDLIIGRVARLNDRETFSSVIKVPDYPPIIEFLDQEVETSIRKAIKLQITEPIEPLNDFDYLDWLQEAHELGFGPSNEPPANPDDRDEFEFVKRKLERKISDLSPDPNTISAVLERYCDFNSILPDTRSKYRREVGRLIAKTGDVPLGHVRTQDLRNLRDDLMGTMKPASLQAVFTPIIGIMGFAFDENIIEANPMAGVKLPRDKRPIEERKWKSFEPHEVRAILETAQNVWATSARGLSDERREAILMVVRVLCFSGLGPIEAIRLTPDDVNNRFISIRGNKTESSTRIVPLHPELADFPAWVASRGLETFQSIKSDRVGSVRHNFSKLIRSKLEQPILDPQKALYSFRSTFVNAMRRAGADIQVQRAVLGHKEAGAIRHYSDGPEFDVKRKWVEAADPRN